jgi:ubiquinol-cytochrome c reductase cytochrome b subunit
MLRATTDPMMAVLCVIYVVAVVLGLRASNLKPLSKMIWAGVAALLFIWLGGVKAIAAYIFGIDPAVLPGVLAGLDAKFWGVVVMGAAVVILFGLPWLDNSPVRSIRYRPGWNRWLYGIFVVNFFVLGYLGIKPPSDAGTLVSQIGTLFYFGFFLLMPWWSRMGEFKPVPERVTFQPH